jgi:hypothetical protein
VDYSLILQALGMSTLSKHYSGSRWRAYLSVVTLELLKEYAGSKVADLLLAMNGEAFSCNS